MQKVTCTKLLYRAFTDRCYAREFSDAGSFRIGRLDRYREIENAARVDATEGLGHYVDGEGTNEHFELGNPIYILCCSAADVDLAFLKRKMGSFIVKINDPERLATDITTYLKQQNIMLFGDVRCRSVDYTKGTTVDAELDEMRRAELSITQKHPRFSDEKEDRLYAVMNANCPKQLLASHIDINLGRRLPYVEVLDNG